MLGNQQAFLQNEGTLLVRIKTPASVVSRFSAACSLALLSWPEQDPRVVSVHVLPSALHPVFGLH